MARKHFIYFIYYLSGFKPYLLSQLKKYCKYWIYWHSQQNTYMLIVQLEPNMSVVNFVHDYITKNFSVIDFEVI